MKLTVKTYRDASEIAKIIGNHNPEAARLYMDGFELRNHIERAAREGLHAAVS